MTIEAKHKSPTSFENLSRRQLACSLFYMYIIVHASFHPETTLCYKSGCGV